MHGTAHVPPVRVVRSRTLDLGFLEPLEHRVLLAISVAVSGNTVSFTGDEAANNLILTVQTGNLAYSVDGGATYSQNLSPGHSGANTRKIGSLSSIVVNLGAGTDTLGIEPALTSALARFDVPLTYKASTRGELESLAGPTDASNNWIITGANSGTLDGQISFSGIGRIEGGSGTNTLIGPAVDTTWDITGPGSGNMDGPGSLRFSGVTNLEGGATGTDTFYLEPQGSIAGVIDGGPINQGTLDIVGAAPGNEVFTASGRHSGTIALPGRTVNYEGMAPIVQSGTPSDVVITGTGNAQMTVTQTGNTITVSSPTMESISFSPPSGSLSIYGGGGYDTLTVASALNLGTANFVVGGLQAGQGIAQISLPSSSSITAGNVTLTASTTGPQSFDPTTLLSDLGLTNATSLLNFDPSTFSPATLLADVNPLSYLGSIATVTDQGNITASGNISISADATNDAGLSPSIGNDELLFHLTEAIATVGGQGTTPTLTATGGTVSISTNDSGTRNTTTDTENVVVSIGVDRSDATIDGATINATGLTLNAQTAANYNITAAKALNLVDGDTTAAVTDGADINVTTGGAQISASENSTISATSSGEGGLAAAVNYVNKNTDAYVAQGTSTGGSSVVATGGPVSIMATGNATITASSTIAPAASGGTNPPTTSAYIFAGNIATGGVAAYVNGSSVQATGTAGNVTIQANNTAITSAIINAAVQPTDTNTRSFGLGVALEHRRLRRDQHFGRGRQSPARPDVGAGQQRYSGHAGLCAGQYDQRWRQRVDHRDRQRDGQRQSEQHLEHAQLLVGRQRLDVEHHAAGVDRRDPFLQPAQHRHPGLRHLHEHVAAHDLAGCRGREWRHRVGAGHGDHHCDHRLGGDVVERRQFGCASNRGRRLVQPSQRRGVSDGR